MGKASVQSEFCFALPPSLGENPVRDLAREFADVLYGAGFATVTPTKTYADLEKQLLEGEVDAAWGPPIVCARVESSGGSVALRAMRKGGLSYRSVLICRVHDALDLAMLAAGSVRKPVAAWVDGWSMGGYILPRHYLRSQGVDPAKHLAEERLLGSYQACFNEVLEGQADITASFASLSGLGYVDICKERSGELRTIAYSAETPNDGLVLSPRLSPERASALLAGLRGLIGNPSSRRVLAAAFKIDGFDEPPPGTYSPLLAYLDS